MIATYHRNGKNKEKKIFKIAQFLKIQPYKQRQSKFRKQLIGVP